MPAEWQKQGYHPYHPEQNIQPGAPVAAPLPRAQRPDREPAAQQGRAPSPARSLPRWLPLALCALAVVILGIIFIPRLFPAAAPQPWDAAALQGAWIGNDGQADIMTAQITGSQITIQWDDGQGTVSLYWQGSFPVPAGAEKEKTVTSAAQLPEGVHLLASQDAQKSFTVTRDRITFSVTVMGVTRRVTLRRV